MHFIVYNLQPKSIVLIRKKSSPEPWMEQFYFTNGKRIISAIIRFLNLRV